MSVASAEVRKLPRNHPRPKYKKTYTKKGNLGTVRVVVYAVHFPGSEILPTTVAGGLPKEEMPEELFEELWPRIAPSNRVRAG